MSLIEVAQIGPLSGYVEAGLNATYKTHRLWEAADLDALLTEIGPRVRAVVTNGERGVSRDVIARLPALEVVANFGVGYDAVDIAACRERGVRVSNTPDVLTDAVAEMTVGLMLALCRRIPQADQYVRQGGWARSGGYPLTAELTGKTAGILGLGRIGKEIARRLQVFKMQIVYHGRSHQPFEPYPYFANLTEMARAVDWLVVAAPGGAGTAGIVNREVLEALGPEGALVNIGRGEVIEEPAMVELLRSGALGGAALDVFAHEPNAPAELLTLENVVLSPHQGSATEKTRRAMGDLVLRNLAAHFAGAPLLTPVA